MRRLSSLFLILVLALTGCAAPSPDKLRPVMLVTPTELAPSTALAPSQMALPTRPLVPGATSPHPAVSNPSLPSVTAPRPLPAPPLPSASPPPNPGAPDVADYAISVRLDPATHHLSGSETITYRNTTQKPIPNLAFHLYLNAFKSMDTIFMRESGGQLRGDAFDPQHNGWITVNSLRIQGGGPFLKLQPQDDGTLATAALPSPLAPGQALRLEASFEAQLPQVFARTGWALDAAGAPFYLVGQWFPKLGVWTEKGWNAYPFHGNAEFFADFGSYDVTITLPDTFVTGATGLPVAERANPDGTRSVRYAASGVIDFAWVASPNLKTATRQAGGVQIQYLYLPEHAWSVTPSLDDAALALTTFSDWYFPYPYTRLTVVDVPDAGGGAGGMEYPTFVTVGATGGPPRPGDPWADWLAITTIHEIAHQWFQSAVATNEDEEPWLDEGFADYSTVRLLSNKYGLDLTAGSNGTFSQAFLASRRSRYLRVPGTPMEGKAWDFKGWDAYTVAAYAKPDMALMTLERELGAPVMLKLLRTYAQTYRFKHPTTADLRQVAERASGQPLNWFFDGLVYHGQTLNYVASAIDGDTITIQRQGDLVIPVDIQVSLADGTRQTLTYDGKSALTKIPVKAAAPVQSFSIDPQHKLIIELDWSDNTRSK